MFGIAINRRRGKKNEYNMKIKSKNVSTKNPKILLNLEKVVISIWQNCKIGSPLYLKLRIWSPYNLIPKFGLSFINSCKIDSESSIWTLTVNLKRCLPRVNDTCQHLSGSL